MAQVSRRLCPFASSRIRCRARAEFSVVRGQDVGRSGILNHTSREASVPYEPLRTGRYRAGRAEPSHTAAAPALPGSPTATERHTGVAADCHVLRTLQPGRPSPRRTAIRHTARDLRSTSRGGGVAVVRTRQPARRRFGIDIKTRARHSSLYYITTRLRCTRLGVREPSSLRACYSCRTAVGLA